jgi:hypothetical protein
MNYHEVVATRDLVLETSNSTKLYKQTLGYLRLLIIDPTQELVAFGVHLCVDVENRWLIVLVI